MTIRLALAFPPPLNNLFATYNGRRIPSRRYKAWRAEASAAIAQQRSGVVRGPFSADLSFERPTRARRDLDGLAKAPLDALVAAGVIEDDHFARTIILRWLSDDPVRGARVFVTVSPSQ